MAAELAPGVPGAPGVRRWLIYALGGGLGHLTRAAALARAGLRRGHEAASARPEATVRLTIPGARLEPPGPPVATVACWPLLRALRGVNLVVGGGGYNTVHECRLTGTPLLAFARSRRYDRQAARLTPAEAVTSAAEALARAAALLGARDAVPTPARLLPCRNGAHEAARLIEAL